MSQPLLSIVLVTDRFLTIRRVIEHLSRQTIRDRLEVVIVGPAADEIARDAVHLEGFGGVRLVHWPAIAPMAAARAAGVRAATAPIVFLGETHSFPHPGFALAVSDASAAPWDAAVPGLSNANPDNAISWASFLLDYGTWADVLPAGQIAGAPTWNTIYRRSTLLELGDRLDDVLSHGDDFAVAYHARARRTVFVPSARVDHANVARLKPFLEQRFLLGCLVAGSRRARWPLSKRVAYVLAAPLIVAVVLSRIRRPVGVLAARGRLPAATIPFIVLGAILRTAGEVAGYISGAPARAERRMDEYELHKLKFTSLQP